MDRLDPIASLMDLKIGEALATVTHDDFDLCIHKWGSTYHS